MKPILRLLLASLATCSVGASFAQPAVDSVLADIAFHEKIAASAFSGGNSHGSSLKKSLSPDSLELDVDSCYLGVNLTSFNQHIYYKASVSERKMTDSIMVYNDNLNEWYLQNVTHYYFSEAGKMTKSVATVWDVPTHSYWTVHEMEFEYNTKGEMTSMIQRHRASKTEELANLNRTLRTFNDLGQMIKTAGYIGSGSDWTLSAVTKIEYDSKGNDIKSTDETFVTEDSVNPATTTVRTHAYTYDADGTIITDSTSSDGVPESLSVRVGIDPNGAVRFESQWFRNGEWHLNGYTTHLYDSEGREIELLYYKYQNYNRQTPVPYFKHSARYNSMGKNDLDVFSNWSSETNAWFPTQSLACTYDKSGRETTAAYTYYDETTGAFKYSDVRRWYYKLKTESLQVTGDSQLSFSFDSKLVPNDSITKCIAILPTTGESVTVQVSRAYISPTDPYTLIIELSRPLTDGDAYTVSLKSGVETEDGRNVQFSMDMGNAATGVAPHMAVTETAVYPTVFTSEIHINADADISAIRIIGINGMQWFNASHISAPQATVSLSNLPTGTYQVSVSTTKSHSSHTIVKQ